MTLSSIQSIIDFLIFFLAYSVSVTIGGSFQAWVADWMGDDTARDAGMTSLSPIEHIDPVGLVCFYAFGIGWGKPVPIDYRNIRGSMKLIFAYLAHVVMYIVIGMVSLFLVVALFGMGPLQSSSSFAQLHVSYPQYTSFVVVVIRMLTGMISINAWLGALGLIRRGFQAVLIIFFPDVMQRSDQQFIVQFGPLLLMLLFLRPISAVIGNIIVHGGIAIATLLKFL